MLLDDSTKIGFAMRDQGLTRLACDPHGKAAQHHICLELADAGPSFDAGYELLELYFGPRGAMDDRESLRRLITEPWQHGSVSCRYDLMLARDADGRTLGAGDCFNAIIDNRVGIAVANNIYVLPEAQGRGIGILIEQGYGALMRVALAAARLPQDIPQYVCADQHPLSIDDPYCWHRMNLWSRVGYRVVPFAAFPLHHLEQVDPNDPSRYLPPQPSLLTPRALHPPFRIDSLRHDELHMFADAMDAVGSRLVRKESSRENIARIRRGIDAYPSREVRLLPLPGETDSLPELSRLLRSCAFSGAAPSKPELCWLADKLAGRAGLGWSSSSRASRPPAEPPLLAGQHGENWGRSIGMERIYLDPELGLLIESSVTE